MKTCYKVVVLLTDKEAKTSESVSYEVLAESPKDAEEMIVLKHRHDWERAYLFEGVQAVFPCNESLG